RRTREFGIRSAIGASPRTVTAMVIGEGLRLGVVGVSGGLLIGLVMGQVLDSVIIEVGAFDLATFTLAPATLLVACLVAAWVPALRATAVNPAVALRGD
ncbi:MAG: FtsX-like permease family protein, partial [Vicinamibacteria bacterium]